MSWKWPDPNSMSASEVKGVNVTAADTDLLAIMFGDHAEEVADILRKRDGRPLPSYIMELRPSKDDCSGRAG